MAQPNLTDATIEFLFSPQETLVAKQLDPLKILWYQTKYSQLWKQRNSVPVPSEEKDYKIYFLALAELDGKLAMIQELMDEHKTVMNELNATKLAQEQAQGQEAKDLAERAAKAVNQSN